MDTPTSDPGPPRTATGRARLEREKDYVRRIEKRFLALRESGLILSTRDFEIVHDWFERGVPAELVIATLEAVFAKTAGRSEGRRIQSIAYCRRAVERAWEERRAALLGTGPAPAGASGKAAGAVSAEGSAFTKTQVAAHLASVAAKTRAAAKSGATVGGPAEAALVEIADRLEALAAASAGPDTIALPAMEEDLVAFEERAVAAGREALGAAELEAIGAKAAQDMATVSSRMSAKAREATLRRAVDAAVRGRLALPRYSLFTMTV